MILSLISTKCLVQITQFMKLSPNHVFSSKNDSNYYISMNFKFIVNTSRDVNKKFKL